jgi:hypothetical protein
MRILKPQPTDIFRNHLIDLTLMNGRRALEVWTAQTVGNA